MPDDNAKPESAAPIPTSDPRAWPPGPSVPISEAAPSDPSAHAAPPPQPQSLTLKILLGLLTVVSVFALTYKYLDYVQRDRTVALFVGIPFLLGWMIGLMRFKKPIMIAFQYTTVVLCVVSPLLGEGVICILMAAPIVYPITMTVAYLVGWASEKGRGKTLLSLMVAAPFLYSAVAEDPARPQAQRRLQSSVVVHAAPAVVWNALEDMTWIIPDRRPAILRLGYPVPQRIISEKSRLGNERRIVFNTGTIVGRITRMKENQHLTLALATENAHGEFFSRWVDLEEMSFALQQIAPNRTVLSHTAVYRRKLPLEFYFDPIERFTARILEDYLLKAFAAHVATLPGDTGHVAGIPQGPQ